VTARPGKRGKRRGHRQERGEEEEEKEGERVVRKVAEEEDRLLSKTEMTVFATELKRSRPEKCE
jgi:hypothetical protein